MKEIFIRTEYIKLDQFLKLADIVGSGGEVKVFIQNEVILVNGEREERRGRKLRNGDKITVLGITYVVEQAGENA